MTAPAGFTRQFKVAYTRSSKDLWSFAIWALKLCKPVCIKNHVESDKNNSPVIVWKNFDRVCMYTNPVCQRKTKSHKQPQQQKSDYPFSCTVHCEHLQSDTANPFGPYITKCIFVNLQFYNIHQLLNCL
jgi:hypothetical protein